jgi:hypothetical protein
VIGEGVGQLLIAGVPRAITNVTDWFVVPKLLLAVRVAVFVPAVVGVPVISPLVLFVNPAGRLEVLNVIGVLPLAVTVLLNIAPTVPLNELVEVNKGAD